MRASGVWSLVRRQYDFKLVAIDFAEQQGNERFACIVRGDENRYERQLVNDLRTPMVCDMSRVIRPLIFIASATFYNCFWVRGGGWERPATSHFCSS